MIWIYLAVIAAIVFGVVSAIEFGDTIIQKIAHCFWTIPLSSFCGIFLGLLLAIPIGIIGSEFVPTQRVTISETPISSIQDNLENAGHFVLGTGDIEGDICFYYVAETDEGKKIEKVKREKTVIVESTQDPKVVVTGDRFKKEWVNFFILDCNGNDDKTTIFVPEGTITKEYTVDLK